MKRPLWLIPVLVAPLILAGSTAFAARPTPCSPPTAPPPAVTPTTADTIGQAYYCVLDHYADDVDNRVLLQGAFAGLAQELGRRGLQQPDATVPAFTGDLDQDWASFRVVYERVSGRLNPEARQAVASSTMNALVAGLHDNHVHWDRPTEGPGPYGLGLRVSPVPPLFLNAPAEALPPLYITDVGGGPAAEQGLKPGDIIEAVNGAPPFVDGVPSLGVLGLLFQEYPRGDQVKVTVNRPSTGRTWTVTMKPKVFQPAPRDFVNAKLLPGGIANVQLLGFEPHAADRVLEAIKNMGAVRGVVLDLRGNGGGSPDEVFRLVGALTHGKVVSYWCDKANKCAPNHTDDTVPLLNLPLVVLTDRDCASACDAFSSAVKDLRLGTLIGTRTAGAVSGPSGGYVLSDNSMLVLPAVHEKAADGEVINGVGVAPDIYLPRTAQDLSNGRGPALAKALSLLTR
jgi:carboxyl-terminal processing protease